MSVDGHEKGVERKYQRACCAFDGHFRWGTLSYPTRVTIVGIGGCFLESEALAPVGEELELAFRLEPELPLLQTKARVAWLSSGGKKMRAEASGRGFAVEFIRIFPEDRARIEEYVRGRVRVFKAIEHELAKAKPDRELIKKLFTEARPLESSHLNHIKKVCREELRYFRLRK